MANVPNPHSNCELCRSIRFRDLPSEDEPGLPHQRSLQALRASAPTCTMCRLILAAALKVREHIGTDGMDEYEGGDGSGWRYRHTLMPNGRLRFEKTYLGGHDHGSKLISGRAPGDAEPLSIRGKSQSTGDTSVRPWLFGNWWKAVDDDVPDQLIGLGVRLSATPYIEDAEGSHRGKRNSKGELVDEITFRGTHLRARVYEESLLSRMIPGRLITSNSGSVISLYRLQRWVDSCNARHACVPLETPLPTRILDLGLYPNARHIKLRETKGQVGPYVALSHCWGKSHRITTTRSTLATRLQGIPSRELPATFLDAVSVTRYLRKRYLWIDSLCIIQDDPRDWELEASRMASVYSNAYLTISASASTDDSTGCLPDRSAGVRSIQGVSADLLSVRQRPLIPHAAPLLGPGHSSTIPEYYVISACASIEDTIRTPGVCFSWEWMPPSFKSQPRTYSIPEFGLPVDPLKWEPLTDRCWTLQERLLSPRTIHYCTGQMYWECKRSFTAEDGSRFERNFSHVENIVRGQRLPLSSHGLALSELPTSVTGHMQPGNLLSLIEGYPPPFDDQKGRIGRWKGGWLSVIEEYSERSITNSMDKLPALSGLASLIARETGDIYYAGLWRNHIIEDLHWRVTRREEKRIHVLGGFRNAYGKDICTPSRTLKYRAPSWSWASLDATIKFIRLDFDRIRAKFVGCHVIRSEIDPFGRVSGGWMEIEGPLLPMSRADPHYKPNPCDPLGFGELVKLQLKDGISYGEAYFDFEPKYPCYALFLDSSNSLILASARTVPWKKLYRRIGIAKFLRTNLQRANLPLTIRPGEVPFGPISSEYPCTIVRVI